MSEFTEKLRREILSSLPNTACCRRSFLCGLLINAECGLDGSVYIRLTGRENTQTAVDTIAQVYGMEAVPEYSTCYGRMTSEFVIVSEKLSAMLSGLSEAETVSELPSFFRCENCGKAFIAGMVLTSVSFCDPGKQARAELRLKDSARASKLLAFFETQDLHPGLSNRKETTFLLFKRHEDVETLIALAGAGVTAMDVMQAEMLRDLKKNEYRLQNCEVNNLAATARAASRYLKAIAEMREDGSISGLEDDLRVTADLRTENPEASLARLCFLHDPPISKSGLTHRLDRILKYYEKTRKQK